MEITEGNLQTLAGYLEKTMAPVAETRKPDDAVRDLLRAVFLASGKGRRPKLPSLPLTDKLLQCVLELKDEGGNCTRPLKTEKFLESVEGNQNYGLLLLHLMDKGTMDIAIRVAGAIAFKNFVKRNWRVTESETDKIHATDRLAIKQHIVGLMLKSPEKVQNQLSDAISIIGREDFPSKWPDLISEMVSKFQTGDFHIINGILRTAHSIFKRYRHEFKSQELWEEIKFVLDNFATHFTDLFKATMELASKHANDPVALRVIFSSILLICKIFYSLNFQDLPEHFEDNIKTWMDNFLQLLSADNKLLKTEDEEEAGLLEQVKSQVCDNVALYAQKYDEEFAPFLPSFVTAIWGLLVSTGQQVKYDLLVSNAIQFLASVAERPGYRSLFEDPSVLASICEKVIVPNIQLRAADEELFEDNPEEYIRRDIEGSDVDTRRRAACDLVQALGKSFEGPVIQNFSTYIQGLLEEYCKNPSQNWKSKDSALYLVTSLASKGMTQKQGVTQTSELVNIIDFYSSQIWPDLESPDINTLPILKADAIKYLMVFRSQLPRELLVASLPQMVRYLTAESYVVHTYAAHCMERLFMVRIGGVAAFTVEDVKPHCTKLLINLFGALSREESSENEYLMKALMRTMSLLQTNVIPMVPQLLQGLTQKLIMVSKNPSKPHFNHYLFESLCIAIRTTCKQNPEAVTSFEEALFQPFTEILQQDVQEFIPYVFQILSLLMEVHGTRVPDTYMALFPHLLAPILWERPGNIPPLVRLIQAFIMQGANQIEAEKLNGLLGVFQKLLASKTHDHEGFYILNSIVEYMPQNLVVQYSRQIFILLFQRLQSSKTTKYIKSLLIFFCVYAIKYGATSLIDMVDGIQPKMFAMVVERLFLTDLQKVSGNSERRICALGVTKILTEAPLMLQGDYEILWPRLLNALIGLFELPEDDSVPDDEHFIEIEDTPGYQAAFSQLAFAGKKERDPLGSDVPDPKLNLAKHLGKLATGQPGRLPMLIGKGLEAGAQTYLQQYMQAANIAII